MQFFHISWVEEVPQAFMCIFWYQRMKKKGDHRPRNSAQYERVVELLIMHKAKWTPRQISFLPSVSRPRSIIRQLRKSLFRSCLMIDLGCETDGNNEICLGVHFALCIIYFGIISKSKLVSERWYGSLGIERANANDISMGFFFKFI